MQLVLLCLVMLMLTPAFATTPNDAYGGDPGCPLGSGIYRHTCQEAKAIIFYWVEQAVSEDSRMGCDASVLMDDTQDFVGEKTVGPNLNSFRGFEVIAKSNLSWNYSIHRLSLVLTYWQLLQEIQFFCRITMSQSGGPTWEVQMGRKDNITASKDAANNNIPSPNSIVDVLVTKFENLGLTLKDMVALSGSDNGNIVAHLDLATPATFDNQYFVNLLSGEGLLPSDQTLVNGNDQTRQIVENYVENPLAFFEDFKHSMLKMGNLGSPSNGQIRRDCRTVN
ncbi:peroxidase 40-like [Vigna radiata var. radiata]|uniref:peroxidase n=1 Tax=Vigna radiata var. radiata TaxID=3916 RepID=A0A3Q0F5R5_VIGRR|nr:peroxidase 40-like [Vigna radiata var. radiata]